MFCRTFCFRSECLRTLITSTCLILQIRKRKVVASEQCGRLKKVDTPCGLAQPARGS
jgi:hypothetical protein